MGKWTFILIIASLFGLIIFLQYRLWFESGGVRDMLFLKQKYLLQAEENKKLKNLNDALTLQIGRLQNSQDAMEGRARSELGMIKKSETFYQIVKKP